MSTARTGDRNRELARLLAAAGVRRSIEDIIELIRGVIAAPPGPEPDAWLDLVAPADARELRACLLRVKDELAGVTVEDPPVAERLRRLRGELSALGIDGLILPLTDEHRNEYLPACAQRLAWLTGFTGSAGVLIVLAERAAVFVDGRYTVQAEAQLDPQLFERHHLVEEPPAKWLGEQLSAGRRIGYDPALHVKSEVERYRAACAKAGAELVALDENPVDRVWTTRPAPPIAPIRQLDERYAGEAADAKRVRMGQEVAAAGAEVATITAADSIAWLLNARGGDVPFNPLFLSFALLHADGAVELFVDPRKLMPRQHLGNGVSIQPIEGFARALAQLGADSACGPGRPEDHQRPGDAKARGGGRQSDRGRGALRARQGLQERLSSWPARALPNGATAPRSAAFCAGSSARSARARSPSATPRRGSTASGRAIRCTGDRASRPFRPPGRTRRCRTTA